MKKIILFIIMLFFITSCNNEESIKENNKPSEVSNDTIIEKDAIIETNNIKENVKNNIKEKKGIGTFTNMELENKRMEEKRRLKMEKESEKELKEVLGNAKVNQIPKKGEKEVINDNPEDYDGYKEFNLEGTTKELKKDNTPGLTEYKKETAKERLIRLKREKENLKNAQKKSTEELIEEEIKRLEKENKQLDPNYVGDGIPAANVIIDVNTGEIKQ